MKYCFNTLWFLLFAPFGAIGGDQVTQSVDMNFIVNIEPPICKLNNAELSVDFGEFQSADITAGRIKKTAEFSFTNCTNVNSVEISFSGDKMDKETNVINNKLGAEYASGISIGLYDDKGKRIQLKDAVSVSVKNVGEFDFRVTAVVQKSSVNTIVTPGNIDTSVNLNIKYN
ncbi:type 1 fimbrial protein [Escherichia coli]|nr:type 1 fimbrial protein [Escherichia coli]